MNECEGSLSAGTGGGGWEKICKLRAEDGTPVQAFESLPSTATLIRQRQARALLPSAASRAPRCHREGAYKSEKCSSFNIHAKREAARPAQPASEALLLGMLRGKKREGRGNSEKCPTAVGADHRPCHATASGGGNAQVSTGPSCARSRARGASARVGSGHPPPSLLHPAGTQPPLASSRSSPDSLHPLPSLAAAARPFQFFAGTNSWGPRTRSKLGFSFSFT